METNQLPNQNGNTGLKAALAVLVLLCGVLGFMLLNEKKVVEKQEATISLRVKELANTQVKLDSITRSLDEKIAEVERLGGDVASLMKVKQQLEQDKNALRRNGSVSAKKYEAKIKEYEAFLAQKDAEIAQLREQNVQLASNNEVLNKENSSLKVNLETTSRAYKDTLTTVAAKNRELSEKVTIASVLKAENVKVLAITPRGKEKDDDAYRARRVEKIKVLYSLAKNPIAQPGERDIYLRLLDPQGAVVSNGMDGSAFYASGKEILYTAKQKVPFENNGQQVEFVYNRGNKYNPGKYNLELYADGHKIGEGGFTVK